jgi:hypothetical protein
VLTQFRWRIFLSLFNVLLAAGLFAAGLAETKQSNYPHANPNPGYIPRAQIASYCMNIPPFVLRNLVTNFIVRKWPSASALWDKWFESYRYHEGADYYFLVFLFWWWIGWRLDIKEIPRRSGGWVPIVGFSLGVILSLTILYVAWASLADTARLRFAGGLIIPVATLVWGLGLFCYFATALLRKERKQEVA